jgi:hypothetical protein
MLILTRRLGEAIILGHDVRIEVIRADEASGTVEFGALMPTSVQISAELGGGPATAPKGPVIVHKRRKRVVP